MPGKARKLDEAQKKVLSHSSTKMQLGSGWKPGRMGFSYVEFGRDHEMADEASPNAASHSERNIR